MVKYDRGYIDGLISLAQRRPLTEREQQALDRALALARQEARQTRQRRKKRDGR